MSQSSLSSNLDDFASKIYYCEVAHQRLSPKGYAFKHKVFMLYLDLDELDGLSGRLKLFSRNRFNLFSFYDSDHLISTDSSNFSDFSGSFNSHSQQTITPLKVKMLSYLCQKGVLSISEAAQFDGSIFLLTYPRIFGYVFNPVSFYFIFARDKKPLAAVAEVSNTFNEMKLYLLGGDCANSGIKSAGEFATIFDLFTAKHFYVSPFSSVENFFHFVLPVPDKRINLTVNTHGPDRQTVLVTSVRGEARSVANLNFALFLSYPLLTLKVISAIHFHALMLWLKKVPFFYKHDSPQFQIDVLRQEKENKHVRVENGF